MYILKNHMLTRISATEVKKFGLADVESAQVAYCFHKSPRAGKLYATVNVIMIRNNMEWVRLK